MQLTPYNRVTTERPSEEIPLLPLADVPFSIILEENLLDRANEMGEYLVNRLNEMKKDHPCIKEVRGKGLIVGAVIDVEDAHVITDPTALKKA